MIKRFSPKEQSWIIRIIRSSKAVEDRLIAAGEGRVRRSIIRSRELGWFWQFACIVAILSCTFILSYRFGIGTDKSPHNIGFSVQLPVVCVA